MLDSQGNALVIVNCSEPSLYASVCITGHITTDPANTLESVSVVAYGQSTYYVPDTLGRDRWGDYSAAALDPDGVTL